MAGHHKWSKVKRLNGALDAKRGKLFKTLASGMTLAAMTRSDSARGLRQLRGGTLVRGEPAGDVAGVVLRRNGDQPARDGNARSNSGPRYCNFGRSGAQRIEFKRNCRGAVLTTADEGIQLTSTPRDQIDAVGDSLRRAGLEPDSIELNNLPEHRVAVHGQNGSGAFLRKSEAAGTDVGVRNAHPDADIAEILQVKIRG